MFSIPLQQLEASKFALRHPDPVQLALSRAQQIKDTRVSHVDVLQLLHLFVGVLFHQIEAKAGYEDMYGFVVDVSGVLAHCIVELEWSRKDRVVARDMIYPFIAAKFNGKNPVVRDVLHAMLQKGNALGQESSSSSSSLAVELLCKVVAVERDVVFSYLSSMSDSERFPPFFAALLFQMASFRAESVQCFAHPKLFGLVLRTLKREAPAIVSDDFVRLVAVLVHVLPYAVQNRAVKLPECMADLLNILGMCLRLVVSEVQASEDQSRTYDVFERLLAPEASATAQQNGASVLERVSVLGRFLLHGVNETADVIRDRSISELSFGSAQSAELSIVTQQGGAVDASIAQPSLTHLKLSSESSTAKPQPGPIFDEGQPSRISSLTIFYDPDGIVGLEYEVVTANNIRQPVQLQPHGVHVGACKVVDANETEVVGIADLEGASVGKPISVVFDDDELFHGVTTRRQGGVLRDLRISTSKRVTPWLLANQLGHVWVGADANYEVQHLDHSHFTPGFAASTMWPILTTIDPIVALVVARERRFATHIADIGVIVQRSPTVHRSTLERSLPELHTSLALQVFWVLYTLFPTHTLRWLRSEAAREPRHSVVIAALLPTVRLHPKLMFGSETELVDGAWDGWTALQILAMARDLCGISGSKYLHLISDSALTLPEANETVASGYVLDLGSMLRRTILELEHVRKIAPSLSSPRARESYPPSSAEMPLDRPRARSSAHALVAAQPSVIPTPARHELLLSAVNQMPAPELKRIAQALKDDQHVWAALSSFLVQQQEHIRILEATAAIEKVRCAQIQQQLVEQQQASQSTVADLERQWSQKMLEVKASYECKLKQLFEEHRTTTDDIKAEQLKVRRDMTLRMLKYDTLHRTLGDESARFRQETMELRGKLNVTEEKQQALISSATLAGATRAAFEEQQQQLEDALNELEMARLKLVSAEENAVAIARKEMVDQLASREALIQSLATNLLMLRAGRTHPTPDAPAASGEGMTPFPLDSGVIRMLLSELQKRPSQLPGDCTPGNAPSRRRSLSAEGIECMPLHYRSRSESASGVMSRLPDERLLLEAQDRIRNLEHDIQQQTVMLEQARHEAQEAKQVHAAQLQTMTRKESSLLMVIGTLERRVIELIRANGGVQPSIFERAPHLGRSISGSGSGDAGRQSSFRSSAHTVSTSGSEMLDLEFTAGNRRTQSSHTSTEAHQARSQSTSRISPRYSSSSSSDGGHDAHPVRQHSQYSVSSTQERRSDRRSTQSIDQCRPS